MLTALVGRLWPPRCRLELLRRSPRHCRWWQPFPSGGGAGVCVGESHQLSDSLSGAGLGRDRHNKARSAGPAHLFAQPWRSSRGCGLSCSVYRWRLGPGVEGDVPWGPGQLRRCSGRHQSPPGRCTPGTSHLLKNCSSRDRIVSALLAVAQGGFPPSSDGAVDEATPGARLGTRIHLVFSHPPPELPQPLPSPARQGLRSAHQLPAQPPCSCAPCRSAPPWGGLKRCRLCGAPVQILL